MGNSNDNRDDDLTRIENLTEFDHEEDSEIDSIFEALSSQHDKKTKTPGHDDSDNSIIMDLDQLEESEFESELPPSLPSEVFENEEVFFESSEENSQFEENDSEFLETNFEEETQLEDQNPEGDFLFEQSTLEETSEEASDENSDAYTEETFESDESFTFEETTPFTDPLPLNIPEKLADLKQFASEFSYGQSNIGSGNPPFSIILRNIKYKDDIEDIKRLLNEFGLITPTNEADFDTSLEMGLLLLPQISEFSAIILAHKFRRFDLDLEVGLSDEVNPPKTGDKNPKGLIKKESIKQNTKDKLNLRDSDLSIADIIMTTSQSIPEYKIQDYFGIHTVMSIIDEDDLEKLQYVDKTLREKSEIFNLPIDQEENKDDFIVMTSSKDAFLSYQKSFNLVFDELKMRLKQKAYSQKTNAVLGVSFQVSPIHLQSNSPHSYSITCSGTFAKIIKE